MYILSCIYMYIYIYLYLYIHIHINIYTYKYILYDSVWESRKNIVHNRPISQLIPSLRHFLCFKLHRCCIDFKRLSHEKNPKNPMKSHRKNPKKKTAVPETFSHEVPMISHRFPGKLPIFLIFPWWEPMFFPPWTWSTYHHCVLSHLRTPALRCEISYGNIVKILWIYIYMYIYICVYIYICIVIYRCTCRCMYIYILY